MSGTRRATPAAVGAGLIVVGAGLAAFAATRVWWSVAIDTAVGTREVTATGSATVPELIPVALVALAGLGAALATSGLVRRCVAALIALAGLLIAGRCVNGLADSPAAALASVLNPAGEQLAAGATVHPAGPVTAIVGGLLITAGGLVLALRRSPTTGLGRRYERGRHPDPAPGGPAPERSSAAPSDADLWKALDAGADPTTDNDRATDPTGDPTAGSGGSGRPVAGG